MSRANATQVHTTENYLEVLNTLATSFITDRPDQRVDIPLRSILEFDPAGFFDNTNLRGDIEQWTGQVYDCLERSGQDVPESEPLSEARQALCEHINQARKSNQTLPYMQYIQVVMAKTIQAKSRDIVEISKQLPKSRNSSKLQAAADLVRAGWIPPQKGTDL